MGPPDNNGEYQHPNDDWLSYRMLHDLNTFTANLVRLDMTADVSYFVYDAAISEARAFVNQAKVGEKRPNLSDAVSHMRASGSMKMQLQLSMERQLYGSLVCKFRCWAFLPANEQADD